jgi:hypothetical protein
MLRDADHVVTYPEIPDNWMTLLSAAGLAKAINLPAVGTIFSASCVLTAG